jgi:hypothetical protein
LCRAIRMLCDEAISKRGRKRKIVSNSPSPSSLELDIAAVTGLPRQTQDELLRAIIYEEALELLHA